jgi:SAM-dependent methyltransferase
MVEIAKRNAAENGVDLDARVGFVEDVPFDKPFEVVLNSGVISFAPDADVFLDRLDALLQPGGTLVIGDLNPDSRGFARRRRRPLLPARELNGQRRADVERKLRERGYVIEGHWYYQITFPLPELMALSEQRLHGLGCGLALLKNKVATRLDHATGSRMARWFDSWIIRAHKAGGVS